MSTLKIGDKIKEKRKELELTQEALANMLGVSKAAVSKWENEESYPDITILPQIAQLFHVTMDELFDYTLEYKPLNIVNEYHFGLSLGNVDKRILDYGTAKECGIYKTGSTWEVRVHFVSTEDKFPHILQKYINPGVLIDGYSVRIADGKIIDDDKPNKHYVCSEKVWEYRHTDINYLKNMLKEQTEMGYSEEEED
ncbi:MAG: helix-turn-helix transcriptional regulator [Ruminococcaceae bacterium]|nr:helix-turn-helix transcriptional regulator [Oscillospiraceae bacterium]